MTTMLSTALPNVFPDGWVERLFARFAVMYGKHWLDLWADVPMADVKDAWASELAGVTGEQIAGALKACGTFPPTLPEFVALCKPVSVPAAHQQYLPAQRNSQEIPPKIRAEIEKLLNKERKRDPKDWAREIMARHECGEHLLPIQIQFAREALQ